MRIEFCGKCGRPFSVSEQGGQMPGTRESEEINCPHCYTTYATGSSNGYFQTAALTAEQEAAYRKGDLNSD